VVKLLLKVSRISKVIYGSYLYVEATEMLKGIIAIVGGLPVKTKTMFSILICLKYMLFVTFWEEKV
jgi:hypothetical protein